MANFFDQFDEQPQRVATANFFDQFDAPAAVAPAPQDTGVIATIDNAARQFVKGIPVLGGAMDKIAAAGDAATYPLLGRGSEGQDFSARYEANLTSEQAKDAAFEKANPNTATALNVTGAVAGLAPAAATAIGARALGMVGSMPARIMQGMAGGAAIGGGDAYIRGQNPAVGTGVGAVVGLASPVVGRAVGAGIEKLGDALAPATGAIADFSRGAVNKVLRAAGDDAVDAVAAQRLGPQGMLLDMGPNLRLQGEALATQPGSPNRIISQAVTERFKGAGSRITDDVDQTLGQYQNFREARNAAVTARKKAGEALYEDAFANARPVDISSAVQYIDDTVSPGLSRVASGGPNPDSIEGVLSRVRDVLAGGDAQRVAPRALHVVKMDLDDMIEGAVRGGKNNQARVLINVRDRVVGALDDATRVGDDSLYAKARTQFRSDSAVINALDDGRTLFSKGTRPDDLVERVKEMSAAEREAFKLGARDAVDEAMGTVKNDALAARTLFGKDWNKQKLESVVGKEQAGRLLSAIERENTFAETYGHVQRGSHTRGRTAAGQEFPNKVEPTNTPAVTGRTVLGTIEQGGRGLIDMLRSSGRAAKLDREASDAARILTAQGQKRDVLVEALLAQRRRQQAVAPIAGEADDLVTILMQAQNDPLRRLVPVR